MLGCVLIAPLGLILLRGVFPHVLDGSFSTPFSRWPDVVTRADLRQALLDSLLLAVLTTAVSIVLGTAVAFLLAHADIPGRGLLEALLFLPVLTPPYVGALAWMLVMQPGGYLEQLSHLPVAGLERGFVSIFGIAGVMVLHLFPLVVLPVRLAFLEAGGRHGLVARLSGASAWQSFRHVTLPLVVPACLTAGLLVFAATLEEFGVAATLGRQANFWVLTTEINRLVGSFPSDPPLAATLAVVLMGITLATFAGQRALQRRSAFTFSGRATPPAQLRLGRWRAPAAVALAGLGLVAGIVPWGSVALSSVLRALGGGMTGANLTLQRYGNLLAQPLARTSLTTSLIQAAVAACAATALGLAVAYLATRTTLPGSRALDGVSLLPSAVPAIVTALAILTLWNLSGVPDAVYKTPFILAVAYAVLYLPIAVRYAVAGLSARPVSLERAAHVSGAGALATWRWIRLPLLRPWLLTTWLTVFAISMRELVASLIVRPPGATTTAVYIFERFEQGDAGQGMAMAMVTLAFTAAVLVAARRLAGAFGAAERVG